MSNRYSNGSLQKGGKLRNCQRESNYGNQESMEQYRGMEDTLTDGKTCTGRRIVPCTEFQIILFFPLHLRKRPLLKPRKILRGEIGTTKNATTTLSIGHTKRKLEGQGAIFLPNVFISRTRGRKQKQSIQKKHKPLCYLII